MNNEFDANIIEGYLPDEILNPHFIFPTCTDYILYYQYFKKLNKPSWITSLIGIEIELPLRISLSSLLQHEEQEIKDILQINQNKPLILKQRIFFFTLFNVTENILINRLIPYLSKSEIMKYQPIIGIYICHPLTPTTNFIVDTSDQLNNSKNNHCPLSVKNSHYLVARY